MDLARRSAGGDRGDAGGEHDATPGKGTQIERAQDGVRGGGGELPHRARMEDAFGMSFGGVRAHTSAAASAACDDLGALAYATGNDVAFGTPSPSPALVAHEVTHVVQQGGVPGAPQAKGAGGDPTLEGEADRIASEVGAGRSVAHLIGGLSAASTGSVQRFDSPEHKRAGDAGSHGRVYTYDDGGSYTFVLTHGDMVFLSGDLFTPTAETGPDGKQDGLFTLIDQPSSKPGQELGTRDEIVAAIHGEFPDDIRFKPLESCPGKDPDMRGAGRGAGDDGACHMIGKESRDPGDWMQGIWSGFKIGKKVEKKVQERFFRLAQGNDMHFAAPETGGDPELGNVHAAGGDYASLHTNALTRAYELGKRGTSVDAAMAHEGAAQHFLTDMFSAGHLRMPRTAIKKHWNEKTYPGFGKALIEKLIVDVGYQLYATADTIVKGEIQAAGGWAGTALAKHLLAGQARDKIKSALEGMPEPTFGDILSRIAHDHDGENGLWVVNDLGERWQAFGDGRLSWSGAARSPEGVEATTDALTMITLAVDLGCQEIELAHALGESNATLDQDALVAMIKDIAPAPATATGKFAALQVVPRVDPTVDNGTLQWKADDFATLWDQVLRTDVGITFGDLVHTDLVTGGAIGGPLWKIVGEQDLEVPGVPYHNVYPYQAAREAILVGLGALGTKEQTFAYLTDVIAKSGA